MNSAPMDEFPEWRIRQGLKISAASLLLGVATSCAQVPTSDDPQPEEQPAVKAPHIDAPVREIKAPGSNAPVREIKTVSHISLVVLDKHCPDIVQPYELTDNIASLAVFSVKEAAKGAVGAVKGLFGGGRTTNAPGKSAILDSVRLAAKQLNWLPMAAEKLYGAKLHEEEINVLPRESSLGRKYYPLADAMLSKILSGIHEKHDYEFQLFILKSAERNAVARPGGYLYMDQGLLSSPAGLRKAYFALAHEIAHVLQRHETKELQGTIVDSITAKDQLLQVMSKAGSNPKIILEHVKAKKDIYSKHHADQELQSDSCAARLLDRMLPDHKELASTLDAFIKEMPRAEPSAPKRPPKDDAEKLAAISHDIVNTPLRRHPNTQERFENLRSIFQEIVKAAKAGTK